MCSDRLRLGKAGEEDAARFLCSRGYRIVALNVRTRFGEIDIIARDQGLLCFIEVKTRRGERFGVGQEAVDMHKQQHLCRAALCYLKEHQLLDVSARFDVVSVVYEGKTPEYTLIKNAFEVDRRCV